MVLEDILTDEKLLISFKVAVVQDGLESYCEIDELVMNTVNRLTGVTEEELKEIFSPTDNALKSCTKKLFKRIKERKK